MDWLLLKLRYAIYHIILNLEEEAYKDYRLDLITRLDSVLTSAAVNKAEVWPKNEPRLYDVGHD